MKVSIQGWTMSMHARAAGSSSASGSVTVSSANVRRKIVLRTAVDGMTVPPKKFG
jgi:hypothetical protein